MRRESFKRPVPRKSWLVISCVLTLAITITVALAVLRPHTFWTTDGGDLGDSLSRVGSGFSVPSGCHLTRLPGSVWNCKIEDDPGSGISDVYRLTVHHGDCWTARRIARTDRGERPLKGCVRLTDYL